MSNVNCSGNEDKLADCSYDQLNRPPPGCQLVYIQCKENSTQGNKITLILCNYKNAFVVIVLTEGVRDPRSKTSTLAVALGSSLGFLVLGGALGTVLIILVVVYRNYKLRLCGNKVNSSVVVILLRRVHNIGRALRCDVLRRVRASRHSNRTQVYSCIVALRCVATRFNIAQCSQLRNASWRNATQGSVS